MQTDKILTVTDKEIEAMSFLRDNEPAEGYYLAFSGGKDSTVLHHIAKTAGVKFDAHFQITTIDPPDLIHFVRRSYSDMQYSHPRKPFLTLLQTRGFPMRHHPWCCSELKETGGIGRVVLTGIRAQESQKRAKRKMVESCTVHTRTLVHPLFHWTQDDIWTYIRKFNIPYCSLYDEGLKRIGCIFCPNSGKKQKQFYHDKYPRITANFIRAFERLYAHRKMQGRKSVDRWSSGREMFYWWLFG